MKTPSRTLSDILVNVSTEKRRTKQSGNSRSVTSNDSMPAMIVKDWLYLGNMGHAGNKDAIAAFGITHILNCSENIPCYHIKSKIKYARIALMDMHDSNLFDYMDAAACFIDECNPRSNADAAMKQNRMLVHCAAGVSRSASVVISYLMSRRVDWSSIEKECIDVIREHTDCAKDADACGPLSLSEAYYFVKSCRTCINPNEGFRKQLDAFEKLQHGGVSTLREIPSYYDAEHKKDMYQQIEKKRSDMTLAKVQAPRAQACCNECVLL